MNLCRKLRQVSYILNRLLWVTVVLITAVSGAEAQADLQVGVPATREVAKGETLRFHLHLEAGAFLHLTVEQQRNDIVLRLIDTTGKVLLQADRSYGDEGPELLLALAETTGVYSIELLGESLQPGGRSVVLLKALRPSIAEDARLASAYRDFLNARTLAKQGDLEAAIDGYRRTVTRFEGFGALHLAAEVEDRLGYLFSKKRQPEKAIDHFRKAAQYAVDGRAPLWEMVARKHLGTLLNESGEPKAAVPELERMLELARNLGRKGTILAQGLKELGQAHQALGSVQKALDLFHQALDNLPPSGNYTRPFILHNLGVLHRFNLGRPERAFEYFDQALKGLEPDNQTQRIKTLNQMAGASESLEQFDKARQLYENSLRVNTNSPCTRASTLVRLARLDHLDKNYEKARERIGTALNIVARDRCSRDQATIRWRAGELLVLLGESENALVHYRASLANSRQREDRSGMVKALFGVARACRAVP
jgi:tetratricopeptide (TPR) repeat protein